MTEITLRDGSITTDPRLDRLIQFDERSRDFPVSAAPALEGVGDAIHSKSWALGPRLDQGQQGACALFAYTHDACAWPAIVRFGVARAQGWRPIVPAAEAFARERYWRAQQIDPWPGGSYPGASPFYEGTSMLAGAKAMQEAGYLGEYRWVFGNVDDLLRALIHIGPVLAGTWWKSGMWEPDPQGVIHCTGSNEGGHGYLIRGVVVPRNGVATVHYRNGRVEEIKTSVPLLRLPNSWGVDWGIDGECLVPVDEFDALRRDQGEVLVPVERFVVPRIA